MNSRCAHKNVTLSFKFRYGVRKGDFLERKRSLLSALGRLVAVHLIVGMDSLDLVFPVPPSLVLREISGSKTLFLIYSLLVAEV